MNSTLVANPSSFVTLPKSIQTITDFDLTDSEPNVFVSQASESRLTARWLKIDGKLVCQWDKVS